MPRTKVSKTSKRFRDVPNRDEKLREFEASCDGYISTLETKGKAQIDDIVSKIYVLLMGTGSNVLQLVMGDILSLNLTKLDDWQKHSNSLAAKQSETLKRHSSKLLNPNDEGYLTEDSSANGASATTAYTSFTQIGNTAVQSLVKQQPQRGRTPGPLSSARARRPRRSRSVCDDLVHGGTVKSTLSAPNVMDKRLSRSKMRTPMASRSKALSADRTPQMSAHIYCSTTSAQSPPAAFLRWPRPGEVVLSKCGSPVVAQIMPEQYANVNIPTRNGIFSLRPKKLEELKPDIIEAIDPNTLNQIRTLNANLNLIMKMADDAATK